MYHKHHTKGLVLSVKNEDCDNFRVELFTEEFGLIKARVQSARVLKSKLRASCQYLSFGDFSLVRGKNDWRMVSACAEKNFFEDLSAEEKKISVINNITNLLRKLIAGEEQNKKLFQVLINFFYFIKGSEKENIHLVECLVLLRILYFLGYMAGDNDLLVPVSKIEMEKNDLEIIAPRKLEIISLINESLKASLL